MVFAWIRIKLTIINITRKKTNPSGGAVLQVNCKLGIFNEATANFWHILYRGKETIKPKTDDTEPQSEHCQTFKMN